MWKVCIGVFQFFSFSQDIIICLQYLFCLVFCWGQDNNEIQFYFYRVMDVFSVIQLVYCFILVRLDKYSLQFWFQNFFNCGVFQVKV